MQDARANASENKVHPVSIVFHIGTSGTFPNPRICSLYLSVETRQRMQPLNGRFPSGAAGFRFLAPRAPPRTHFPSVRRGTYRSETNSRYRFHFVKGHSLREPARYVIYRSLTHELPTRARFLSVFSYQSHRNESIPLILSNTVPLSKTSTRNESVRASTSLSPE